LLIEEYAYARAGLLGNPSDGYFGKTIALSIKDFRAWVRLKESSEMRIVAQDQDAEYRSIQDMVEKISMYGYYGGVRLIKAVIKIFFEYCRENDFRLGKKNFSVRYDSTIPRQLGLGGSSAISTAALRALMKFYQVDIPKDIQPSLILDAEKEELGINAGFMDRVIQVYEGCVYMDLDREYIKAHGYGKYESLEPKLLPRLFLAYKPALGKVSGRVLNDIQIGFERGNSFVVNTLEKIADIAEIGKKLLLARDKEGLFELMNENFNLRSRIMKISSSNQKMIRTARLCGASAKFAGSGGAIIGMYKNKDMFSRLAAEFDKIQVKVIKPTIKKPVGSLQ